MPTGSALVGRQRLLPRVILSGREAGTIPPAHLPGLSVQAVLPLGDLGTQAGQALLRDQFRSRSIRGIDLVPRLVEVFGSDPLTLIMLARFAESLGREGRDVQAELTALVQDGPSRARGRLDGSAAPADPGGTLWQGVRAMARLSHSPFAWRSLRLAGPLAADAAIKGRALAFLAPEVMNFVAAEFRDRAGRTVPDARRREELVKVFVPFFEAPTRVSIRDHDAVDAMLYREDFTVSERLPLFGRLPATVPGRLPEFHGALPVILGGEDLAPVPVQEAVAALARFVPWWPRELWPRTFAEALPSPTLVAALIDTADRCGRLPDLAATLARQPGAPAGCGRLSALIEAAVGHYRRAANAGATGG